MLIIDQKLCIKCALCSKVCPSNIFVYRNDDVSVNKDVESSCFACGHCMAVCPTQAVKVDGLDYAGFKDLPKVKPSKDELSALLSARRSIRNYEDKPVPREVLEEIIELSSCSPMGIPPSTVEILVLDERKKIDEVVAQLVKEYETFDKYLRNPLAKFFIKKTVGNQFDALEKHIVPEIQKMVKLYYEKGEDRITYHCPVLMVFHANRKTLSAQENCLIALTHVVVFAESVGLGTCINGLVVAIEQSKTLRKKLGIPPDNEVFCGLTLGYPKYKFRRSIPRKFASVKFNY